MYSMVRDKLIDENEDFKKIYNALKFRNEVVEFNNDDLKKFKLVSCSKKYPELTLDYIFLSGINYSEAGMTSLYLSEVIDEKLTIHHGKCYFLRGYNQIYDCEHTWIETKTHLIDPVLLIKLPVKYKDKFLYQTIYTLDEGKIKETNYSDNEYFKVMINRLINDNNYRDSIFDFSPMHTIEQCLSYNSDVIEGTFIRDYLLDNDENFRSIYKKHKIDILEIDKEIEQISNIKCSVKNPNITLKYIYEKGLNIGNCGLICRFFGETIKDDYVINIGICSFIKGTYNSPNGEHAWIETNKYLYDTTLMIRIPIKLKEQFNYITKEIIKKSDIEQDYRSGEYIYSIDRREQMIKGFKELKYKIINESKVR